MSPDEAEWTACAQVNDLKDVSSAVCFGFNQLGTADSRVAITS